MPARQVGRLFVGFSCSVMTAAILGYLSLPLLAAFQTLGDGDKIAWSRFLNLAFALKFAAFLSSAIGVLAVLPWIIITAYAGRRGIRNVRYFYLAGLCVAAFAVTAALFSSGNLLERFTGSSGSLTSQLASVVLCLVSGAAAGIVYWSIAGRHPAFWQNPKPTLTDRVLAAILRPTHWVRVVYAFAASVSIAMMFVSVMPAYVGSAFTTVSFKVTDFFTGWLVAIYVFGIYAGLAIPAILFAEKRNMRGITWFFLAGMLTSLLGIVLASDRLTFDNVYQNVFYVMVVTGGIAGGLLYWFIAGRHSGAWRNHSGLTNSHESGANI